MLKRVSCGRPKILRRVLTTPYCPSPLPACKPQAHVTGSTNCNRAGSGRSDSLHSQVTSNSWHGQAPARAQPRVEQRLRINSLVVVEGKADKRAVLNALDAPVAVTSGAINGRTLEQLQKQMQDRAAMIILMDPDVAGRQARNRLSDFFPAALHSFVPQLEATSPIPSRWHEAGNIGVEHAPPQAIRLALQAPRQLQPLRKDITRELLESLQLAGTFSDSHGGSQAERRRRVTALLGLGDCNVKQLLRQLNTFSFSTEELQMAVQQVEAAMQAAASAPEILQYNGQDQS
ncbi:hypothetical protein WJX74_002936 [Apatococcus lobatus]|uniref:Toprim domain-containing protein n=1 Tax=Apatococcus lobatus TaxID=904363 RepID=A0AAW1QUU5_9CHLO